jgi:hypothetical protein
MTEELIEVEGKYRGTLSIRYLKLLYSIKNRKFIKGYLRGDRVEGKVLYRIYPGTYIMFEYFYWCKNDPPRKITISKVAISKEETKIINQTIIKFYNDEFVKQFPQQVVDLFNARPRYHSLRMVDFNKVYSDEENQKLLQLVVENKEIIEGEEHQ